MSAEATLRRVPQQERSRRRLARVLDAADAVLAAEGTLATTRIAAEAGMAVGSVYQYFPDKEAIAEALAHRYWDAFAQRVEAVDRVEDVLSELTAAFRAEPGFRALWFGGLRTERLRDATRPYRTRVGAAIERLLAERHPGARPGDRATVARMVVLAGDGLLREAFRMDPAGDPLVLGEARTMLDAYIQERLA